MKRLVLFSGGVESTALLTLANPERDVVLFVDATGEMSTALQADARRVAKSMGFELKSGFLATGATGSTISPMYQLYWLLAVASVRVKQTPDITQVWYGLHAGEPHAERVQEDFVRLREAWKIVHPNVLLRWPLYSKTKEEQWELIPAATKKLVRNCDFVRNCGHCPKCTELKALPGSFWSDAVSAR